MKQLQLYNILYKSAGEALKFQDKEGYFPAGHNGPWKDEDSPVRTTAHWAMTIFKAYEITGDEVFLKATTKACDYLIKIENRPSGYTFYCRSNKTGKNMCNGLIGQVWAIEPLIFIGKALNKNEYLEVARKVLLLHKYDRRRHVWHNVEINGKGLDITRALNQHVWFAALLLIMGKILHNKVLKSIADDFFVNLPSLVDYIEEKGLISHRLNLKLTPYQITKRNFRPQSRYKNTIDADNIKVLSDGYLSFILCGLALAYENSNEEDFCGNEKLKNIIRDAVMYVTNKLPFGWGEKESYRWGYNPVGIEMAYAIQIFHKYLQIKDAAEKISFFLNMQFELYYDVEKSMLAKNTDDPIILAARLYEATRLHNYTLSLPD